MQVVSGSGLVLVNRIAWALVPPGSRVHLCTKCLSSAIPAAWQSDRRTAEGHDTRGTNISFISIWSDKLIREGYFPSFPEASRWCPSGLSSRRKFSPSVLRDLGGTRGQTSPLSSRFDNTYIYLLTFRAPL